MNKNSIVHFVGFISRLAKSEFVEEWMQYAKEFVTTADSVTLREKTEGNGKYKYISQHSFGEEDFSFSFMKDRHSENFPDQKARVIMMGGYSPVEIGFDPAESSNTTVLAFFIKDRIDMEFYTGLVKAGSLNIYQPFYENCMYGYILEFLTNKAGSPLLIEEIQKRKEGAEVSIFLKCPTPYSVLNKH